ncbi:MAG: HAMP domain-containing histidine kinase [Labilithrix sp.]|nr:HAMP domain-containing histidine kinase [Labilithrix sp.]
MKLRHRFALTFALASLGTLVLARVVTIVSFTRLQEYELDQGLRARAREESDEVALLGRTALERERVSDDDADPLEQLVTYGALYRADGTVVADTTSFAHAPALHELGVAAATSGACFDFRFRGKTLRGVIVELPGRGGVEGQYLLLAASRREIDDDARQLLALGWWIVAACLPFSLALGWLLGRRMTEGVETLAAAAGRVTAGDLDMDLSSSAPGDDEVAALGRALREMVAWLKGLIETERRFASHAAHELRSPLAALRGELELALRRKRTGEEYEAILRDALEDTNRLVDLAEDLLVVARVESAAGDERAEEIDARSLVEDAVAASVARASDDVVVDAAEERVVVRGARVALVRMLRNLIDNAVVHGAALDHGGVRVRVRRSDDGRAALARIEVEDDGPGVAVEDRGHLFEPFHRGATARQEPGAGLGLGIAREIARRHGGDLVMDSPGAPTRFVVTLRAEAI